MSITSPRKELLNCIRKCDNLYMLNPENSTIGRCGPVGVGVALLG